MTFHGIVEKIPKLQAAIEATSAGTSASALDGSKETRLKKTTDFNAVQQDLLPTTVHPSCGWTRCSCPGLATRDLPTSDRRRYPDWTTSAVGCDMKFYNNFAVVLIFDPNRLSSSRIDSQHPRRLRMNWIHAYATTGEIKKQIQRITHRWFDLGYFHQSESDRVRMKIILFHENNVHPRPPWLSSELCQPSNLFLHGHKKWIYLCSVEEKSLRREKKLIFRYSSPDAVVNACIFA